MSWAVWINGLPGSGKSVIAATAAEILQAWDCPVVVLELDQMRRVLTPRPNYSDAEHEAVYRALVRIGAGLVDAGIPVIFDAKDLSVEAAAAAIVDMVTTRFLR